VRVDRVAHPGEPRGQLGGGPEAGGLRSHLQPGDGGADGVQQRGRGRGGRR
jgi:hypothetical protein